MMMDTSRQTDQELRAVIFQLASYQTSTSKGQPGRFNHNHHHHQASNGLVWCSVSGLFAELTSFPIGRS